MNRKETNAWIKRHEAATIESEVKYGYTPFIAGYRKRLFDAPWVTDTMCKPCGRRNVHVELGGDQDSGPSNDIWAFTAQSNSQFWFGQECEYCRGVIPSVSPEASRKEEVK